MSTRKDYTKTMIYLKWKIVCLPHIQVENFWKVIHLAVRNLVTNYNETCYQGLRKKYSFL